MNQEFIGALKGIVKDKGISEDLIFSTIEDVLIAAYKKNYASPTTSAQNVKVSINRETGEIYVHTQKIVIEDVYDDVTEISLEEAREVSPRYDLDDIADLEVVPKSFGRVAAQLARGVIAQRIREAERDIVYSKHKELEYDIVTGTVLRKDKGNVFINLGRIETSIGPNKQIPREEYKFSERVKLYVVKVKNGPKGAQILVSRTYPGLVKRLFELEVLEIYEGIAEIKSISREADSRSKIAVYSNGENVDPMGACVGPRDTRVQNIVDELKGEKIDIIKWSKNPGEFITTSLNPAKVLEVVTCEGTKSAEVVIDDNQLSLAVEREEQDVRLAAKLTNWKIDIKSKSQSDTLKEETVEETIEQGRIFMKVKEIPLRMCTGCMEMKPKKELIRVVKSPESEVSVDLTGKGPSRGMYICKDKECLEKAFKTERLSRNLNIAIDEVIYDRLREEIENERIF